MVKKNILILCSLTVICLTNVKGQALDKQLKKLSDAPDESPAISSGNDSISYEASLKRWKSVSDVNHWMENSFHYNIERAKQLADNSQERAKINIYSPAELYQIKSGVCIDLSRFAVETINIIDTSKHVQYLLIEFEPISLDGNILKNHWTAIYHDASGHYILADSKRPGHIAGPYQNVEDFISEYQIFRNRKILSWRVLDSYQKQKKKKTSQLTRPD